MSTSTGISIDDDFDWQPHTAHARKTASENLYLLSQLKHFVDTSKCNLFDHVQNFPRPTYSSIVLDSCSDNLFNQLNSSS